VASALLLLAFAGVVQTSPRAQAQSLPSRIPTHWYKGNTHTHTTYSDGDTPAVDVVRWYKEHGYQFVVLTDHNSLHPAVDRRDRHRADVPFLVMSGEEVSDRLGDKPIHINGLNLWEQVEPLHGASAVEVIQRDVDSIRRFGGAPQINHPNFKWAITSDDLLQVADVKLFEIFNGHREVNNLGGGEVPGAEETWDRILSSGKVIYGVASDDAHQFKQPGMTEAVAGPGRGWVVVRAARLGPEEIVEAMEDGDFYSSTGVELRDYQVTTSAVTIMVEEQPWCKYRIQFIGRDGIVLKEVRSSPASYTFNRDLYVRAKVVDSNGRTAWTQPVFP
jgi:predicted metal-dependent phosphoesterase TrpH